MYSYHGLILILALMFASTFNEGILYKALLQLAFPAYVIILVIIVIVASECSSKFAKIVGKGNPVAVLATLILLSYAKFFNAIITSISLLYLQPAHGSRNVDITRLRFTLTQGVELISRFRFQGHCLFPNNFFHIHSSLMYHLHCSSLLLAVASTISRQDHL